MLNDWLNLWMSSMGSRSIHNLADMVLRCRHVSPRKSEIVAAKHFFDRLKLCWKTAYWAGSHIFESRKRCKSDFEWKKWLLIHFDLHYFQCTDLEPKNPWKTSQLLWSMFRSSPTICTDLRLYCIFSGLSNSPNLSMKDQFGRMRFSQGKFFYFKNSILHRSWIAKVGRIAENRKSSIVKQSFLCWYKWLSSCK